METKNWIWSLASGFLLVGCLMSRLNKVDTDDGGGTGARGGGGSPSGNGSGGNKADPDAGAPGVAGSDASSGGTNGSDGGDLGAGESGTGQTGASGSTAGNAGAASAGGAAGNASAGGAAGTAGGGAAGTAGMGGAASELGKGTYEGTGTSTDQYAEADVYRNGVGYKLIANGWGSGWQSHSISWNGTSFKVLLLNGSEGANFSPAGYPTEFCGYYSMKQSAGSCGLPATISSLQSVKTGWRWKANGNTGEYNAAWDIWLGNGNTLSSYLMVWLRDPPNQQPAGSAVATAIAVSGLPGTWDVWSGTVSGRPIVNYVKHEGQDLAELEYDVLDVYHDAQQRKLSLPGASILAVAVGFEVWNGPITNLVTDDFFVNVK